MGSQLRFYSLEVGKHLDFVAVHFYPQKAEGDKAIKALKAYEVGKPLVVEEMFPLQCGQDELADFVQQSAEHVDGWISFYWGVTSEQLRAKDQPTIGEAITASWLDKFKELSSEVVKR